MHRFALALLLGCFCVAGHAACDTGLAERMHAKLYPNRVLDHERAVCHPWRAFQGRFIVVLPMPRAPARTTGFTEFDLSVLVVQQADNGNTERAAVVSRVFEPAALTEETIRIRAIEVDTARYLLASDARAFGLRVSYQGASRANPYSSEKLTLYVPQGPKLAKVLDGLEMLLERGEWDANCKGSFETVRSSLSLAGGSSNGYADLLLRRTRSETRSSVREDECVTQESPAKFSTTTLQYDGSIYRLPKGAEGN